MPKRARETTDCALSPQPLKKVPLHLEKSTRAAGFTVGDLVIVLDQMQTLFKTGIALMGPCEGSLELLDIPTTSWISDKKRDNGDGGFCTELRLRNSNDAPALKVTYKALHVCGFHRLDGTDAIVQGIDDTVDTVRQRLEMSRYIHVVTKHLPAGTDLMTLLDEPFVLNLRASYPAYSWPTWAFGALEAFVTRRIQLKVSA